MATELSADRAPVKAKKSKWKLMLIVVLAAALAAAAAYYYHLYGPFELVKGEPAPPPIKTVDMGDVTVNLADAGPRYLRVQIVVELPQDKQLEAEFETNEHRIRHELLHALRQKKAADVRDPEDMENICTELLAKVNNQLTTGRAAGLYFQEYLLQ